MTIYLKYNTASQEIPLGYFVDSTDGNTEETGLTINNTDIKLWKTGATALANKNSGGGTHISNGIYYAVLDATDTNTIGPMVIFVHVSGALAVRLECVVLPAVVYDSMIAGSDYLETDVTQWKGATAPAMTGDAYAALTSALADSVPSDGTRPTAQQALYMICQYLMERSVSGTTVTVKKVDGSTTLMTLTLNDGTTPTSITRAT